jgi:hypothetical protein
MKSAGAAFKRDAAGYLLLWRLDKGRRNSVRAKLLADELVANTPGAPRAVRASASPQWVQRNV